MSITAEELDDWIGSEVVDASDAKLGKVTEVYYRGENPVIVEFRTGRLGRKFHLAALEGAAVSMKHLRLGAGEPVETDGGLTAEALEVLTKSDSRLVGVPLAEIESRTVRAEREQAAREAAAHAATLEADATHRAEEAKIAARVAQEAAANAATSEQASRDAQTLATKARQVADALAGRPSA
jgi:hypothetical protein